MEKKLFERIMKKKHKRQVKQCFRVEKVIKRKGDKLYVKWKGYDNSKFKLDFSNYATKSDLKTQQVSIHRNLVKRLI